MNCFKFLPSITLETPSTNYIKLPGIDSLLQIVRKAHAKYEKENLKGSFKVEGKQNIDGYVKLLQEKKPDLYDFIKRTTGQQQVLEVEEGDVPPLQSHGRSNESTTTIDYVKPLDDGTPMLISWPSDTKVKELRKLEDLRQTQALLRKLRASRDVCGSKYLESILKSTKMLERAMTQEELMTTKHELSQIHTSCSRQKKEMAEILDKLEKTIRELSEHIVKY